MLEPENGSLYWGNYLEGRKDWTQAIVSLRGCPLSPSPSVKAMGARGIGDRENRLGRDHGRISMVTRNLSLGYLVVICLSWKADETVSKRSVVS